MKLFFIIILNLFFIPAFATCQSDQAKKGLITSLSVSPGDRLILLKVNIEGEGFKTFSHSKSGQSIDASVEFFELAKIAYLNKLPVCVTTKVLSDKLLATLELASES